MELFRHYINVYVHTKTQLKLDVEDLASIYPCLALGPENVIKDINQR